MKNQIFIIMGAILVFAFGMQVFMFYRIHEKLDQRYAIEKKLDLSSHRGSDSWVEDTENWDPYQELFQMRDQMQQVFDHSMSRFHRNAATVSNVAMSAIKLKDEKDRYIATLSIPNANESSLNVAVNEGQLTISVKTESINEQKDSNNKVQRSEQYSGEFQGSITLPTDVNKEAMKTEYSNGVLTVILPKVQ